MLDEKNKKLLYELDSNSRLSVKQLSKKIGLSAEATRYRLNNLTQKGIIKNFSTYLNFTKLGYFGYCVYCRYHNITEQKKNELKKYLRAHSKVYWVAEFGGRIDLAFSILAKNPAEFNESLTTILNKYSKHIAEIKLITKLETIKYPRKYFQNKSQLAAYKKIDLGNYQLSNVEKKILKYISTNARITSAEISEKIKIPLSSVIYSIKKMINNEIIGGFTISPMPSNFGFESFQVNVVLQNVNNEELNRLKSYCEKHLNIIFFIKVLGEWHIELIYEIENARKMQECLIELRSKFGDIIKDIELVNLFEDYIKLNHYPFKN